jgi:hypothetical protein
MRPTKYLIFGRPYNLGMEWRLRHEITCESRVAAFASLEFKYNKVAIDQWDERVATMGGASEYVVLTIPEFILCNTAFGLRYRKSRCEILKSKRQA